MPRRRWRVRGRREPLTADIRRYVETGFYGRTVGAVAEDQQFSFPAFQLAGGVLRGQYDELRVLWDAHRDDILAEWIAEAPGSRPYCWWIVEAREARRCLAGATHLFPVVNDVWRRHFGVPLLRQLGHFEAAFESEPTYLDRLRLLGVDERLALAPDAFAPDVITVDRETYEELVARRAAREKGHPA